MDSILERRKAVQRALGVTDDGIIGPKTRSAWDALWKPVPDTVHTGLASSFADPADVAGFKAAKARGLSDDAAFAFGDNGIGFWGDDTTGNTPMCALPPDDWKVLQDAGIPVRGAHVAVIIKGQTVICQLRDTMPRKINIKNGAIIDLNPGAQKAFGLVPPFMVPCSWKWA